MSPKIVPKFPQNSCQNSPKSGVKIPPNFVSKLHRKSHFLVGPRGPPILARNPPKIKNSLLAQQRELFLAIFGPRARAAPKFRARGAGPPGARRAGRPAGPPSLTRRSVPPSLIYTCPQDRRRPQAEANKRRPGSAPRAAQTTAGNQLATRTVFSIINLQNKLKKNKKKKEK